MLQALYIDLYLRHMRRGAHKVTHTHSSLQSRVRRARVQVKHTRKVNNLTGVKSSFSLPPSLFSFALVFLFFLFQHSFSTRTPVPLSINYLYCLCSDLQSPVRICMDGARQACLILCHREFQHLYIIRNMKKSYKEEEEKKSSVAQCM